MTRFASVSFVILMMIVSQCCGQEVKARFRSDGSICLSCRGVPCPLDGRHQCNCGVCLSDDDNERERCPSCAHVQCPIVTHQCICGTCWADNDRPADHIPCPTCRSVRCPLFTHQCVCGVCESNEK